MTNSNTPEVDYVLNAISVLGKSLAFVVLWLLMAIVLLVCLSGQTLRDWWRCRSRLR